jgi:hypothetical protein
MKDCGTCHLPEPGSPEWEEIETFREFLRLIGANEGRKTLLADPAWCEWMNVRWPDSVVTP